MNKKTLLLLLGLIIVVVAIILLVPSSATQTNEEERVVDLSEELGVPTEVFAFQSEEGLSGVISYNQDGSQASLSVQNQTAILNRVPTASGVRYEAGEGEDLVRFEEHQGEATLTFAGNEFSIPELQRTVIQNVLVGPSYVPCTGVGDQQCLSINGELFYDTIEGFDYEEGFVYIISVAINERENVPADASNLAYNLIEVVSKTPEAEFFESGELNREDVEAQATRTENQNEEDMMATNDEMVFGTWTWNETQYENEENVMNNNLEAFSLQLSEEGTLFSTTDCNTLSGSFSATDGNFETSPLAMTRKACPGETQEGVYAEMLQEVSNYALNEEGNLELWLGENGRMIFLNEANAEMMMETVENEEGDDMQASEEESDQRPEMEKEMVDEASTE